MQRRPAGITAYPGGEKGEVAGHDWGWRVFAGGLAEENQRVFSAFEDGDVSSRIAVVRRYRA